MQGTLAVHRWEGVARSRRAARMTFGIGRWILLPCLLGIFVHPLLVVVLIILLSSSLWATTLYVYFRSQEATFTYAEGKCPFCNHEGRLNRYLWDTVAPEVTLTCPSCGQTCRTRLTVQ